MLTKCGRTVGPRYSTQKLHSVQPHVSRIRSAVHQRTVTQIKNRYPVHQSVHESSMMKRCVERTQRQLATSSNAWNRNIANVEDANWKSPESILTWVSKTVPFRSDGKRPFLLIYPLRGRRKAKVEKEMLESVEFLAYMEQDEKAPEQSHPTPICAGVPGLPHGHVFEALALVLISLRAAHPTRLRIRLLLDSSLQYPLSYGTVTPITEWEMENLSGESSMALRLLFDAFFTNYSLKLRDENAYEKWVKSLSLDARQLTLSTALQCIRLAQNNLKPEDIQTVLVGINDYENVVQTNRPFFVNMVSAVAGILSNPPEKIWPLILFNAPHHNDTINLLSNLLKPPFVISTAPLL